MVGRAIGMVVVGGCQQLGDVEAVGGEVDTGVAQVVAVEPDLGLRQDAVEAEPGPAALGRRGQGGNGGR